MRFLLFIFILDLYLRLSCLFPGFRQIAPFANQAPGFHGPLTTCLDNLNGFLCCQAVHKKNDASFLPLETLDAGRHWNGLL